VVEHVGVADQLLRELRIWLRQRGGEVRRRLPDPLVQPALDLVGQHVPGPAVLDGREGVPVPFLPAAELVEQHPDVTPRELCHGPWHNLPVRPPRSQGTHVVQVAARPAPLVRELLTHLHNDYLSGGLELARRHDVAAAAAVGNARAGRVRWRAGLAFGAAGVAASLLGTHLNARVQPEALLIAFAVLMLIAAGAMLAKNMVASTPNDDAADQQASALRRHHEPASGGRTLTGAPRVRTRVRTVVPVLLAGLVVGFLTGFLGVGGGFIIVPALVLTLKYDMPTAVGTSLVVISLNSAVALLARGGQDRFHWAVIVPFTLAAIAGSGAGKKIADRRSGPNLTRGFAVLLLLVAGYVLLQATLSSG
jgi:uncharacterized protein